MKKEFLVDVPVAVQIWIRPENQRKQFEILREARPSTLLIISDGGRNEEENRRDNETHTGSDLYDRGLCDVRAQSRGSGRQL